MLSIDEMKEGERIGLRISDLPRTWWVAPMCGLLVALTCFSGELRGDGPRLVRVTCGNGVDYEAI